MSALGMLFYSFDNCIYVYISCLFMEGHMVE